MGLVAQVGADDHFGLEGAVEALFLALRPRMAGTPGSTPIPRRTSQTASAVHSPRGPLQGGALSQSWLSGRPIAAKERVELGGHRRLALTRSHPKLRQVAAVINEQGKRMATPAAAEREVALEIHLPEFIERGALKAHMRAVPLSLPRIDEAAPTQDRPDGRRRGQPLHAEIFQTAPQPARSPTPASNRLGKPTTTRQWKAG